MCALHPLHNTFQPPLVQKPCRSIAKRSKCHTQRKFFNFTMAPMFQQFSFTNPCPENSSAKKVQRVLLRVGYYVRMKKIRSLYLVETDAREDDFHTFRTKKEAERRVESDLLRDGDSAGKHSIRRFVWAVMGFAEFNRMADGLDLTTSTGRFQLVRRINQRDDTVVPVKDKFGEHRDDKPAKFQGLSVTTLADSLLDEEPLVDASPVASKLDSPTLIQFMDNAGYRKPNIEFVERLLAELNQWFDRNAGTVEIAEPKPLDIGDIVKLCREAGLEADISVEPKFKDVAETSPTPKKPTNSIATMSGEELYDEFSELRKWAFVTTTWEASGDANRVRWNAIATRLKLCRLSKAAEPKHEMIELTGQRLYNELFFMKVDGESLVSGVAWKNLSGGQQDRYDTVAYRLKSGAAMLRRSEDAPTPVLDMEPVKLVNLASVVREVHKIWASVADEKNKQSK